MYKMESYTEEFEEFRNIENYSHILLIRIRDELDDNMKTQIMEKINNIDILYDLSGGLNVSIINARITWKAVVTNIPNELKFYTDVNGILGDVAVNKRGKYTVLNWDIPTKPFMSSKLLASSSYGVR